ncbi:hypothetical protein [Kordia sp.]|uniref:hypothetical protein n=1 Tax=Kordia sp. TaxID=1965332 RepID=UPI003D6C42E0
MKNLLLIITFTLLAKLSFAQTVDFDLIHYKGFDFYSTKSEIIKKLGKPQKVYDPKYECGFLSTDTQDGIFLTLDYGTIKFTGNEKENYVLEQVDFEKDHSIIVKYGDRNLSYKTDFSELIDIFGDQIKEGFGKKLDGAFIVFSTGYEDGLRIYITNGKLTRLEYWSPC